MRRDRIIPIQRLFVHISVAIVVIAIVAKIYALIVNGKYLNIEDGLFSIFTNRQVVLFAIAVESVAVAAIYSARQLTTKLIIVAVLGGSFSAYHLGLMFVGSNASCSCLGNLLDWLHFTAHVSASITKAIAFFMTAGSNLLLFFEWFCAQNYKLSTAQN